MIGSSTSFFEVFITPNVTKQRVEIKKKLAKVRAMTEGYRENCRG